MCDNVNRIIAKNKYSSKEETVNTSKLKILSVYITTGEEVTEEVKDGTTAPSSSQAPPKKEFKLDEKLEHGLLSRSYYMVVTTENFPDDSRAKFKVSIKSKEKLLSEKDDPVKIMVSDSECESVEVEINNYFKDETIANKGEFRNKAIVKFSFNRGNDKDKELISNSKDRRALLYVTVEGGKNFTICGDEDSPGNENEAFYYNKPYALLHECFCDRDMTEKEVTTLVQQLRTLNNEKDKDKKLSGTEIKTIVGKVVPTKIPGLFNWPKSEIKSEDRTFKRLTEELNKVFTKYKINTCNRKSYFIAQLYVECMFRTSIEEASGEQYELKNWEDRVTKLETEITEIDKFKTEIDRIGERLGKTEIDVKKSQVKEIDSYIAKGVTLTSSEQTTIDNYKAIFEIEWIINFNEPNKKTKYENKSEYSKALASAKAQVSDIKKSLNTDEGDGSRYKGKGLIQLTWRDAYERYFKYLKKMDPIPDAVKDKTVEQLLDRTENDASTWLSKDLFYATDSAAWFFMVFKSDIKGIIDNDGDKQVKSPLYHEKKKNCSSIQYVSKKVNGGNNALNERTNYFNCLRYEFFRIREICVNYEKLQK